AKLQPALFHGQGVSLGARIARFGRRGALLDLARSRLEQLARQRHTRAAPLGLWDVVIIGRPSIFGAASCTLEVASNSRPAESQCSSARPSSRPVAFQIS